MTNTTQNTTASSTESVENDKTAQAAGTEKNFFKKVDTNWVAEMSGVMAYLAGMYYGILGMIAAFVALSAYLTLLLGAGAALALTVLAIILLAPIGVYVLDAVCEYGAGCVKIAMTYVGKKFKAAANYIGSFFKKSKKEEVQQEADEQQAPVAA